MPTPRKATLDIEWNIDPIKSDGHDTGEVQIWADMPKEIAALIVHRVNMFDELVETIRGLATHPTLKISTEDKLMLSDLLKRATEEKK